MQKYKEVKISEIFDVIKWKSLYTKTYINENIWDFLVFSSQTINNGIIWKINSFDYDFDCITWTTDWIHAWTVFLRKNIKFSMTTHCWALKLKDKFKDNIFLNYIFEYLKIFLKSYAIWTDNKRITTWIIKGVSIKIPIKENWEFDLEKQKEIADKYEKLEKVKDRIRIMKEDIEDKKIEILSNWKVRRFKLEDIFDLSIKTNNSKFTKTFVNNNKWDIPVYSASKDENIVWYWYVKDNLNWVKYFENCLTWNIDWSIWKVFYRKGRFSLFEKVIPLVFFDKYKWDLYFDYLKFIIEIEAKKEWFWFTKKAGKWRLKKLILKIPIKENWEFDLEKQKKIAKKYEKIEKIKNNLIEELEYLEKVKVEI